MVKSTKGRMHCGYHPKYTGKRYPTSECLVCLEIYYFEQKKDAKKKGTAKNVGH
jgi:hypothetical protein